MWLPTESTHCDERVFRFGQFSVNMTSAELRLVFQCLSDYNCLMLSDGVSVEERAELLALIRKFRKLKEGL